ncbi:hypothetical protein ACH5RR_008985 [Cinchona calisaya]|uniref:DUF7745 domain-containing protein n=1 Tax=Cinchona calisaya TaxID=153742 RepID=A0ABD3ADM9_9GENT
MLADLIHGVGGQDLTIIPTIVADILVACTNCQNGVKFFKGSSLLLQVWFMEHLGRQMIVRHDFSWGRVNWVQSHNQRINRAKLLKDKEKYIRWLSSLKELEIQWVLEWVPCHAPSLQFASLPFIPLIGNEGIVPYMPFQVLRQFGRVQTVPPKLATDRFNDMFDKGIRPESIPEKSSILSAWASRRACQESLYDPQQRGIFVSRRTNTPGGDSNPVFPSLD